MKHLKHPFFLLLFIAASLTSFSQVGIGTTDPKAALDVVSTTQGFMMPRVTTAARTAMTVGTDQTSMQVYDTDTGSIWYYDGVTWQDAVSGTGLQDADGDTKIQVEEVTDDDIIRFDTDGTERIRITKTGEVLIGTVEPTAKLNINRTETTATNGTNIHGVRTDVNVTGAAFFQDDVNGYWADVKSDGGVSTNGIFVHATQTGINTNVSPLMPLVSGTYGEAQVATTTSAYNAIGAAGTAESLQAGTNTGVNALARNGGRLNIGVNGIANATDPEIAFSLNQRLTMGFSAGVSAYNTGVTATDYVLYADGAKSYFSGNVGVGITTPTEKLDVSGNIKASGTITPDYVFEKYYTGTSALKASYTMMSLKKIENFTRANNHLPGVPSAKEVEKEGGILVNRATEINLEKIEELYLHTIEQQKQIELLQAQVKALLESKE